MSSLPIFASSRPVVVLPYQVEWPQEFSLLAQRIRDAAGQNLLEINHIGSTAVPGLCAKNVLDVQLQVVSLAKAGSLIHQLRMAGFRQGEHLVYDIFHGLPDQSPELEKLYMREPVGERRIHIHIREKGRFNTRYALLFRDYLRAQASARAEYGELKLRAAALFPDSIAGYLYVKEPIFHLLYYAADLWAEQVGWKPADEAYQLLS
ncbi:GrpB domain, predicted nucleotidyltransferase, UPF0157 family [Hymenobacter gelipurpurascens]|uniref:GrpB domain, predicted nucleotidyltransferase, UPF0157 family n=1 Tax=Hymenobacter gelipurpurascens TaxID=89968 RepID=A0A212UD37_9BACT|nr:GrpB family protein [Hymenobacter gelipurpurascens]SNC76147.1 GrpB domain, predicted nucleotidyltransferase, UPF0157 family [Hymenobacter gelipurpurascens]